MERFRSSEIAQKVTVPRPGPQQNAGHVSTRIQAWSFEITYGRGRNCGALRGTTEPKTTAKKANQHSPVSIQPSTKWKRTNGCHALLIAYCGIRPPGIL